MSERGIFMVSLVLEFIAMAFFAFLHEEYLAIATFVMIIIVMVISYLTFMSNNHSTTKFPEIMASLLPKNGMLHTVVYYVRGEVQHLKHVEPVTAQMQAMGYEIADVKIAPPGFGTTYMVQVSYR